MIVDHVLMFLSCKLSVLFACLFVLCIGMADSSTSNVVSQSRILQQSSSEFRLESSSSVMEQDRRSTAGDDVLDDVSEVSAAGPVPLDRQASYLTASSQSASSSLESPPCGLDVRSTLNSVASTSPRASRASSTATAMMSLNESRRGLNVDTSTSTKSTSSSAGVPKKIAPLFTPKSASKPTPLPLLPVEQQTSARAATASPRSSPTASAPTNANFQAAAASSSFIRSAASSAAALGSGKMLDTNTGISSLTEPTGLFLHFRSEALVDSLPPPPPVDVGSIRAGTDGEPIDHRTGSVGGDIAIAPPPARGSIHDMSIPVPPPPSEYFHDGSNFSSARSIGSEVDAFSSHSSLSGLLPFKRQITSKSTDDQLHSISAGSPSLTPPASSPAPSTSPASAAPKVELNVVDPSHLDLAPELKSTFGSPAEAALSVYSDGHDDAEDDCNSPHSANTSQQHLEEEPQNLQSFLSAANLNSAVRSIRILSNDVQQSQIVNPSIHSSSPTHESNSTVTSSHVNSNNQKVVDRHHYDLQNIHDHYSGGGLVEPSDSDGQGLDPDNDSDFNHGGADRAAANRSLDDILAESQHFDDAYSNDGRRISGLSDHSANAYLGSVGGYQDEGQLDGDLSPSVEAHSPDAAVYYGEALGGYESDHTSSTRSSLTHIREGSTPRVLQMRPESGYSRTQSAIVQTGLGSYAAAMSQEEQLSGVESNDSTGALVQDKQLETPAADFEEDDSNIAAL